VHRSMAFSQRLEIRQGHALVMTPQLMQAIKLLQLSNIDLAAYVDKEVESNPLLERAEGADTEIRGTESHAGPASAANEGSEGPAKDTSGVALVRGEKSIDGESAADADAAFSRHNNGSASNTQDWSGIGALRRDGDYNLEAFVPAETTLSDHLIKQLAVAVADPVRRMIGHYLINMLDETGYLAGDIAQAAEMLGAPRSEVDAVVAILQTFDPSGVCARNLSECLALQLKERNRFDPAMQALVENLDLLGRRDLATLRKICGVGNDDLADMIGEIRQLDPKPGLAFGTTLVQPIVPDIFVRPQSNGSFQVELNVDTLPKVLVNQSYYAEVAGSAKSDKVKTYLDDCMQTANWLVRALDQRAKTILKVSSEIVRQQGAFFAHGVQHLRPLNLKTVADAISMHESTVSRVTANKYMATNRGIFELKFFFTAAIAGAGGGDAHSAEAVRHRIRHLIDGEDAKEVLSDDTIVEKLREAGIDIARRTVAKYREALRIPSSVQRRREKSFVSGAEL
jgi:RNA polymerase sigma-54 factor